MKPFPKFLTLWFSILAALALMAVIVLGVRVTMDFLIYKFGSGGALAIALLAFTAAFAFLLRTIKLP